MRKFDYKKYENVKWDSEILELVDQIHEYKGRQELFLIREKQKRVEKLWRLQLTIC